MNVQLSLIITDDRHTSQTNYFVCLLSARIIVGRWGVEEISPHWIIPHTDFQFSIAG